MNRSEQKDRLKVSGISQRLTINRFLGLLATKTRDKSMKMRIQFPVQ